MADINEIDLEVVREFTSANKAKGDFRFFRYSQGYLSDDDRGNKPNSQADQRITGIQLQTLAKCLQDFFGYSSNQTDFDSNLNSNESGIENAKYKNSAISKTVAELQTGNDTGIPDSINLRIQLIRRYNESAAKGKTTEELKSAEIASVPKEQLGVIGPVTYNFIIRQAIYQWFKNTYLDGDSFLAKSLPILNNGWSSQQIPSDQGYYIYVSPSGNPNDKPYPTIGVLFDSESDISNTEAITKARSYIDFLLLRDSSSLEKEKGFYIEKIKSDNGFTRYCVYADLAEILYCKLIEVNLSAIDMIKAGISLIHKFGRDFYATDNDTIKTIKNAVKYPIDKFIDLESKIDETAFNFKEPDPLLKDAKLFAIANDSTKDYSEEYSIITQDLLTSHLKYTNELADRIVSERSIKKNVALRDYKATPINEQIRFFYDENYNLLAASIVKNPIEPSKPKVYPDDKCITVKNNENLTIPEIDPKEKSLLENVQNKDYLLLTNHSVVFTTEFFIRQFYDKYDKIRSDVLNDNKGKGAGGKDPNILEKSDMFISNKDFSKLKVDYLYIYDKNTLLEAAIDEKATLQFVKLKTSNYWTVLGPLLGISETSLDDFIKYHYPELVHNPSAEKKEKPKPSGTDNSSKPAQPKNVERLKASNSLVTIPNDINLDTKLKVTDLLAEECFAGILAAVSTGKLNTAFSILKFLDIPYLISLVQKAIEDELNKIINSLQEQGTKDSVLSSKDKFKDCFPPPQPKVQNFNKGNLELPDIAALFGLLALYNLPKIPYLTVADVWKTIKKQIYQLAIQIVLEFVIQLLNLIIAKIKEELCKPKDATAGITNTKKPNPSNVPRLPPGIPQPPKTEPKCSYEELLSTNLNISKLQIYNVLRGFYKVEIKDNEFDSYFAGLSSLLSTQQIINTLSNSIDDNLYLTIKKYSSDYPQFNSILFNITTTSSFFNFISRYVDLTPCYQQLLLDNRNPNYCFDDRDLPEDLSDNDLLNKADDLLSQLSNLCEILKSESLADRLANIPVLDDPSVKDALSQGAKVLIDSAHKNFLQMKTKYLTSFESIDAINDYITTFGKNNKAFNIDNQSYIDPMDTIASKLIEYDKGQIMDSPIAIRYKHILLNDESAEQEMKITFYVRGNDPPYTNQLSETAKKVNQDALKQYNQFSEESKEFYDNFSIPRDLPIEGVVESKELPEYKDKIKIIINPMQVYAYSQNEKIIRTSTDVKTSFIVKEPDLSLQKSKSAFSDIFFNDDRFSQKIATQDKIKAKEIKNYYYVYDNLLKSANKNSEKKINNLLKYKELEKLLEEKFNTEV